ncbi:MAG: PilZ domain-containing protein [Candidatus Acidiferrales bacterium]
MSLSINPRIEHRAKIEQPIRVRVETDANETDLCHTLNISKNGLYFVSARHHYYAGMHVHLILGYHNGDPVLKEWVGEIMRIEPRDDGQTGVAVRILIR